MNIVHIRKLPGDQQEIAPNCEVAGQTTAEIAAAGVSVAGLALLSVLLLI